MDSLSLLIFDVAYYIAMLALAIAFLRFLMGPTCVDRVVALDTMTICGIALIIFIAMNAGRIIYIDVALVYALLSFLGVIAVARYLEGGL